MLVKAVGGGLEFERGQAFQTQYSQKQEEVHLSKGQGLEKNNGIWNTCQEWESELARIRKRLINAPECSGESADPEFVVMTNSVALSFSLAVLSHCKGAKKGYSIYPRFKF